MSVTMIAPDLERRAAAGITLEGTRIIGHAVVYDAAVAASVPGRPEAPDRPTSPPARRVAGRSAPAGDAKPWRASQIRTLTAPRDQKPPPIPMRPHSRKLFQPLRLVWCARADLNGRPPP